MRALAFLRVVHRWLGLALAAIVLAVAASGGLLLLRDRYYRAWYPPLGRPVTAAQFERRAGVLTAIETRWSRAAIRLVKFPQPGVNAFQVWLHDGTEAFVHPETGSLVDQWRSAGRLPGFLFDLHAHLLAGEPGELANGIAALMVVFMTLTGVVLWWPARRGSFRLRGVLPRRLRPADLLRSHAAVGALAACPIVVFVASGALMVFYEPTGQVLSGWFDSRPPEQPDALVPRRPLPPRDWSDVLAALDSTFADGNVVYYSTGTPDNARLMFRTRLPGEWHPNGRSYVVIDPYTAEVVQAIDARAQGAGTRFMYAVYPVHAAKTGTTAMVVLAAFAAVALTWLAGVGGWTYLARRRTARNRLEHAA